MTGRIVIGVIYGCVDNVQFHVLAKDEGGTLFYEGKKRLVHIFTGDSSVSRRVFRKIALSR